MENERTVKFKVLRVGFCHPCGVEFNLKKRYITTSDGQKERAAFDHVWKTSDKIGVRPKAQVAFDEIITKLSNPLNPFIKILEDSAE